MAIDTKQWYDRFWQLYDEKVIVLSPLFYGRLIQNRPYYYSGGCFRRLCWQIEWFLVNRDKFSCNRCRLHGKCIDLIKDDSTEATYRIDFARVQGEYKPTWIIDCETNKIADVRYYSISYMSAQELQQIIRNAQ